MEDRVQRIDLLLSDEEFDEVVEQMRLDYSILVFKRKHVQETAKTEAWFEANRKKPNVVTEGLFQYEILKKGASRSFLSLSDAPSPTLDDEVLLHYKLMRHDA